MAKPNLKAIEIMTFISSGNDYQRAIQFYKDVGFELDFTSDTISVFRKDKCRFFLQSYPKEWMDNNFMMALEVESLDDWWRHLSSVGLEEKYPGVKVKAPEDYPWGKREIHLIDTCGVLWHISSAV